MQFTTQIPVPESSHKIGYDSDIVSLGSCFAVNIGQKLEYFKFRNTTNPFGILFHPLALEKFISSSVNNKQFTGEDIFFHSERWHCYDAHSDLSHPDKEVLLNRLNTAVAATAAMLTSATHIIITLGTAWVYRHTASGALVANCHKIPQKEFTKELLKPAEIQTSLHNIISLLKQANPDTAIVFTISPVRHIKDGFTENQRSKAHLVSALHETLNAQPITRNCFYFPSYEIMMDELRDYRFYAEDMIHPNNVAVDYIWERFTQAFMTSETAGIMKEVESIQKALLHRPFNPDSEQHTVFLEKITGKIATLQQHYPHISF